MHDSENPESDTLFPRLLAKCLHLIERGEVVDRDRLTREHPEHAASICEFLDNYAFVGAAIGQVRGVDAKSIVDRAYEMTLDTGTPDSSRQFQIGDSIRYVGEYEIIDEIARGGMGVVFRARQPKLRRDVALKMILSGRFASKADVDRFHREARAAAALKHPNIVAVHEIGEHEGHHYFTMDLVTGRSLASIIGEETLSPLRTAALIKTISAAVEYAHQHGVLHRDLKPANILIDNQGQPHVTDFGLAKSTLEDATIADLTATGQILGTPSYMSPEQASGKHGNISVASDVYSLGAIMYACLAGRGPFVAESVVDTIRQVLEKEPVAVRLLNPRTPKDLENICLKCLQKEPHRRYPTAHELACDLDRFLAGRPVAARPVAASTKAYRWARRNPGIASLAALSILLLVTGTAVSSYFAVLANQRAENESRLRILAEQSSYTSLWNVYKMSLFPMLKEWQEQDYGLLRTRLNDSIPKPSEPDFRDWEWHFLKHSVARRSIVSTKLRPYHLVRVSQSGRYIAARRDDHSIDILDAMTLRLLHTLTGTTQSALDWHPTADWLAAADSTNSVQVWDVEQNQVLHEFTTSDDETKMTDRGVAWNPDGTVVALGGTSRVDLFDLKRGSVRKLNPQYWASHLDWSPDGKWLATGRRTAVCVIDVDTDQKIWGSNRNGVDVEDLKWNEAGTQLAVAWADPDRCIRLYDQKGSVLHSLKGDQITRSIAWLEDGEKLATAGDDYQVHFWDVSSGKPLRSLSIANDEIQSLAVATDSNRGLLASSDGVLQWVPLAQLPPFESQLIVPTGPASITELRWAPTDENLLAVGNSKLIHVIDVNAGKIVRSFAGLSDFIAFDWHPTQRSLVTLDVNGQVVHRNVDTDQVITSWNASSRGWGVSLQWSPDGRQLLIGAGDSLSGKIGFRVEVIDPNAETNRVYLGDFSSQSVARWSPDSKRIAVYCGRADKTIQVWDLQTRTIVAQSEPLEGFLGHMDYSPDGGRIALGGNGGNLVVFDIASGRTFANPNAESANIRSIRWSPSGTRLMTCGENGKLRLWDARTLELVLTQDERFGSIADWSIDGRRIATCTTDGILRIWDSGPRD